MHEGTEAIPTGRDEVFLHGLPTRVKHLETVVDALHRDSVLTQGALSGLSTQVASLADTIKDVATKLDDQRTRRPDWGTMATWAGVLLVVGAMAFTPISHRLDRVQAEVHEHHNLTRQAEKEQRDTHLKDAFLMGQQQARLEALEKSEARTWLHCDKNAP